MAYFRMIRTINQKIKCWESYNPKNYFTKYWKSIQIQKLNNKKQKLQLEFNRLKFENDVK